MSQSAGRLVEVFCWQVLRMLKNRDWYHHVFVGTHLASKARLEFQWEIAYDPYRSGLQTEQSLKETPQPLPLTDETEQQNQPGRDTTEMRLLTMIPKQHGDFENQTASMSTKAMVKVLHKIQSQRPLRQDERKTDEMMLRD